MNNPYPDANIRTEFLNQYEFGSPQRIAALKAMHFVLNKVDAFMKEKYEKPPTKVYAAVFRWEEAGGANPGERVEYFCQKDITPAYGEGDDATPELYANDFLMEEGEWLDNVLEEDPITDPVEVIGVLESALEYIRTMTENGIDEREIELLQRVEKLLVSYVTVQG